jgi:LemA protein
MNRQTKVLIAIVAGIVVLVVLPSLLLTAGIFIFAVGWDALLIIFAVLTIVLFGVWVAATYNSLVRYRNHCDEAWSDVDAELRRRYDLIPNLVTTIKGYIAHEREVLERVTIARNAAAASQGSPSSQARDENALVGALRQLLVVVESYPDLKASQSFLKLQRELVNTEDRIQSARRFYNSNVRDYNNRVQAVPSNLVAGAYGFKEREFFEIESAVERQRPVVKM